ncbi:MAG: glycoside hydrolase family 2, partial [Butyrivibrio sp.]|nr:glycoside hydrolase family 2 [Butyrivibrio sp.]
MDLIDAIKSIDKSHEDDILHRLYTPWGENLDKENVLPEYPRPQLQRSSFFNLNGMWSYAFTQSSSFPTHNQGQILVPFSPESILSGVERRLEPSDFLWYKRSLPEIKIPAKKSRLILHFGAVDQSCKIYVNGEFVKKHVGGFLPISVDITNKIKTDGEKLLPDNEIMVCVQDSTDTSWHSRGKQKLKRGGMYYTAQSGIWQT